MSEVFVDTAFCVALVNPRDSARELALGLAKKFAAMRPNLITTDAVLIEIGNYFCRSSLRIPAIDLVEGIRSNKTWHVEPLSSDVLLRAQSRYRRARDKNWSLTDCISMEVMQARGVREIATTDRGFAQAGFKPLL
jgi:predicted nucleic acid-binding protein